MGLITWVVIGVIILAIIGLGWQTFLAGVKKGADKIGLTPIIKNHLEVLRRIFQVLESRIFLNFDRGENKCHNMHQISK
jgi:hypothetical protein